MKKNYVMGLDLGSGSIGLACVGDEILHANSFLFESSEKDGQSYNQTRREKRLARKRYKRIKQRLSKINPIFHTDISQDILKATNVKVWQHRSEGIDRLLSEKEWVGVLYHLAKNRGWAAVTKKDEKERKNKGGEMTQGITRLQDLLSENHQTVGQYLYHSSQNGRTHIRNKEYSDTYDLKLHKENIEIKKPQYFFVATRDMIKEEAQRLFEAQRNLGNILAKKELEEEYFKIAFKQNPLKSVWDMVGYCQLETSEKRATKSSPSAELFLALQNLNNIKLSSKNGEQIILKDNTQYKKTILQFAISNEKPIKIKEICDVLDLKGYTSNFEQGEISFGNTAVDFRGTLKLRNTIQEKVPNFELSNDPLVWTEQERFILNSIADLSAFWSENPRDIMQYKSSEKSTKYFQEQFTKIQEYLDIDQEVMFDILLEFDEKEFKETINLSVKALNKLLPKMGQENLRYDEAWRSCGYEVLVPFDLKKIPIFIPTLSKEEKLLIKEQQLNENDFLKGKIAEWLFKNWKELTDREYSDDNAEKIARYMMWEQREYKNNRVLHRAISLAKRTVNTAITAYGKPELIRMEMLRELGKGEKQREEISKQQNANKKKNEALKKELLDAMKEHKISEIDMNKYFLKYKLWREQDCKDPYDLSENPVMDISEIFNYGLEIDHILPWSRSFDDSFANKILTRSANNQNKKGKTPKEWIGDENWAKFVNHIKSIYKDIDKSKKNNNFTKLDRLIYESSDLSGFSTRNLRDSAYITTAFKDILNQYLGQEGKTYVQSTTGQLTSILRKMWQLDWKNRDDKRHHALDAIIVAMSGKSIEQKITNGKIQITQEESNRDKNNDEQSAKHIDRMIATYGVYIPQPWKGFKKSVLDIYNNVFVYRKIEGKGQGKLHDDTIKSSRLVTKIEEKKSGEKIATTTEIIVEKKSLIKDKKINITIKDLDNMIDIDRYKVDDYDKEKYLVPPQNIYTVLKKWIEENQNTKNPPYPCLPQAIKNAHNQVIGYENSNKEIRKIRTVSSDQTGFRPKKWANNSATKRGFAGNDGSIRVDLFQNSKVQWGLVSVYTHEVHLIPSGDSYNDPNIIEYCNQNNKLTSGGTKQGIDNWIYQQTIHKNEYVVMVDKKGDIKQGYYISAHIGTGQLNLAYYFLHTNNSISKFNKEIKEKQEKNIYLGKFEKEVKNLSNVSESYSVQNMKHIFTISISALDTFSSVQEKIQKKIEELNEK